MFRIFPIQSEEQQKEYASACGARLRQGWFAFGMENRENGEIMGFCQFEIDSGAATIADLRPKTGTNDVEAMFILGRSAMSFIEKIGVTDCYAEKDAGDRKLLGAIGFRQQDEEQASEAGENSAKSEKKPLYCCLAGMFDGHCGGTAVKLP